jgi:rhamnose utilization protein RhaD (predicted bifunctional aldolase and dehydrogenase)/NAD(P)-dependent dehydrogenase (short-subunit alcohol dehydrogenase family)
VKFRRLQRLLSPHHASASQNNYNDVDAEAYIAQYGSEWGEDLALRCYTSHLIGKDPNLVLHGGGNTSVKMVAVNAIGEKIDVTAVKGSGYGLDVIPPVGFPQVDTAHCRKLLQIPTLTDFQMVNELRTHMMDASSPNPSVEALLHAMLPAKFVDHSHADAIVTIGDLGVAGSTQAITEAFSPYGIRPVIIPYAMPGINLALTASKYYGESQRKGERVDCLILLQHGLFTWGATAKESYEMHIKCVQIAQKYIEGRARTRVPTLLTPRTDAPSAPFSAGLRTLILNAMRGAFARRSGNKTSWLLRIRNSDFIRRFVDSSQCEAWSQIGTITPDHVIRTKGFPMVVRGLVMFENFQGTPAEKFKAIGEFCERSLEKFEEMYHAYFRRNNDGSKVELDPLPRVLLLEGIGLVTAGRTVKAVKIAADIYEHTVPVILNCMALGGYRPVSEKHLFECEYWDLEQRKLKLGAKSPGKMDGKVAYITGGASGIGLATAEMFGKNGAAIFLADVRQDRVDEQILRLSKMGIDVSGAVVDVTDQNAVLASVQQCTFAFGGVDFMVSNAGVVVQAAPGMASCPPETLMKSMNINFLGHQWVSAAVVQTMLAQGTGGGLLYNVSKAPLNPGPQLGPYAVAKAATLALMRQYAIEYGAFGITSNAVNPDRIRTNLFDMKLVEERAKSRGLTAEQYFASNLLKREVLSVDVAHAFFVLALSEKTTGGIFTVDGGNISASPR